MAVPEIRLTTLLSIYSPTPTDLNTRNMMMATINDKRYDGRSSPVQLKIALFKSTPAPEATRRIARCHARESRTTEEVVSCPMDLRLSLGTRPVFKSPETYWKLWIYLVHPRLVPILMKNRPPKIPARMPTVAQVMPMSMASVSPSLANVEPTAAAVPWPPENPEAKSRPKPSLISGNSFEMTRMENSGANAN